VFDFAQALGYLGTALQVALVVLLLLGPFKRYFPLLLYVLAYAGTSLYEGWFLRQNAYNSEAYINLYWTNELALNLLLFLMVIQLTSRALEGHALKKPATRLMILVVLVGLALPFAVFEGERFSPRWSNGASQLYYFAAAILTLVLWTALIATKRRDRQLLMVSAGLGVALTSGAMTWGVRLLSANQPTLRNIAEQAHPIFFVGSVLIWCWAFWPKRKPAAAMPAPGS
jgi:hypothetical protein